MQDELTADGGAAHVLQLISDLSESDLQVLTVTLASPLCDRAAKVRRERTDRGLDPTVPHEKADGTGSKFAHLPKAAYGTREDFFSGLERCCCDSSSLSWMACHCVPPSNKEASSSRTRRHLSRQTRLCKRWVATSTAPTGQSRRARCGCGRSPHRGCCSDRGRT